MGAVDASIVIYTCFTFLFFVIKSRFTKERSTHLWMLFLFVILSAVIQFAQNASLSSAHCGEVDTKLLFYSTLIPWIVIFGGFFSAILAFPGWLRVFSNTIGSYFLKDMYGMDDVLSQLFPAQSTDVDQEMRNLLGQIYTNKSSLILEMDVSDVREEGKVFPTLEQLASIKIITLPALEEDRDALKKKVYSMLFIKEDIGYAIWFWLIGIFCILVSTNTLLSSSCSPKKANYSLIFK